MTSFDIFDPVFLDQPWDTYREFREITPAFHGYVWIPMTLGSA